MEAKPRILIIDDDDDVIMLLGLLFEDVGFKVDTALEGKTGLDKARSIKPDIILLDIIMPGMDGWELCQELRSCPETKSIPIIMLTGVRTEDIDRKAQELGANRVVIKTCENEELIGLINEVLERTE